MSKAGQATVSGMVIGSGLGIALGGVLLESGLVGPTSRPLFLIGFAVMLLTFPLQVLFRRRRA